MGEPLADEEEHADRPECRRDPKRLGLQVQRRLYLRGLELARGELEVPPRGDQLDMPLERRQVGSTVPEMDLQRVAPCSLKKLVGTVGAVERRSRRQEARRVQRGGVR